MKYWNWPLFSFAVFCLLGLAARLAIGQIYNMGEAVALLQSLSNSGLFLGSASATASATTLALMLALIGMVRRAENEFDGSIYKSIDRIAQLATASLMVSLFLLLALVFPIGEFESLPSSWYTVFYDLLFTVTVVAVGLLAATVVMLYQTVRQVIEQITPDDGM